MHKEDDMSDSSNRDGNLLEQRNGEGCLDSGANFVIVINAVEVKRKTLDYNLPYALLCSRSFLRFC